MSSKGNFYIQTVGQKPTLLPCAAVLHLQWISVSKVQQDKQCRQLVFVVIGSCADQMLPYPLPWALSAAFVGLGLYWIGNETARNQDKLKNALNIPGPLCIILGLLEVKLILSNGYINMREGTYACSNESASYSKMLHESVET